MKKQVLTLLAGIMMLTAFAHFDNEWKTFGNVERFIIGNYLDERTHKANIFAQLVDLLSDELDNKTKIKISLRCDDYLNNEVQYSVAYTDDAEIFIMGRGYNFSPVSLLQLAEYAILNKERIRENQKPVLSNYPWFADQAVSGEFVDKILAEPLSTQIERVLAKRVYRSHNDRPSISYYFENLKYHLYINRSSYDYGTGEGRTQELVLKSIDDVFQFSDVHGIEAMVFDSDSSFYYIDINAVMKVGEEVVSYKSSNISARQVMGGRHRGAYTVDPLGPGDLIGISYKPGGIYSRGTIPVMIYDVENEILFYDLRGILRKTREGEQAKAEIK